MQDHLREKQLERAVLTITLEDIATFGEIPVGEITALTEDDFHELRKRVEEGTMSGFEDVAKAAWDCVLLDRETRRKQWRKEDAAIAQPRLRDREAGRDRHGR